MGIIIRQSLKTTIISYIGIAIGTFNILWLAPKLLRPEEIGLTRLLTDLCLLLASLVQLGSTNIADRFFPYFRDENEKHHGFFIFLLIYPMIGFLIFTSFFFFLKNFWISIYEEKSPLLLDFYFHVLPLTLFLMYTIVLEAYVRAHFKTVFPTFIREIFSRITFTLAVLFYFYNILDLNGLVIWIVLSYLISVLLLLAYIKKIGKFYLSFNKNFFKERLVRDMIIFSLFILIGGAGSLIAAKIDTIMLASMTGLGWTGIYSIAFYMGSIIEVPRKPIAQISTPLLAQAWKNNEMDRIEVIYRKSALNQFIIGGLLFLLIWGNVDSLFHLIPHSELYSQGKYVILFIALGKLINMGTGMSGEIILTSRYYRFYLLSIVVLGVLTFITNYIFIPVYGINGAAFTTLFCVFVFNILNFLFIWFRLKLQPFSKGMLKSVVIFCLCYGISWLMVLNNDSIILALRNILLKSVVLTILFIGGVYLLKISSDVNSLINITLKKIRSIFP